VWSETWGPFEKSLQERITLNSKQIRNAKSKEKNIWVCFIAVLLLDSVFVSIFMFV